MGDYWAEKDVQIRHARKDRQLETQQEEDRKRAAKQRFEERKARREEKKGAEKKRKSTQYDWKEAASSASKGRPGSAAVQSKRGDAQRVPEARVEARRRANRSSYLAGAEETGGWEHLVPYHPQIEVELVERRRLRDRVARARDEALRRIAERGEAGAAGAAPGAGPGLAEPPAPGEGAAVAGASAAPSQGGSPADLAGQGQPGTELGDSLQSTADSA